MFTMHSSVLLARRESISIKRRSTETTLAPRKHAVIQSLAFSGCGWLGCFHLGVAHHLISVGALTTETKLAGTSGGALVATAVGCGLQPRVLLEELKLIGNHCNINGTFWRLRDPLRAMINQVCCSLCYFMTICSMFLSNIVFTLMLCALSHRSYLMTLLNG
jgi:predicted acylesterase/phospholipase RssA